MTGNKLTLDERRKARAEVEPCPLKKPIKIAGRERPKAFDQELFEGRIAADGQQIIQPPLPYGATPTTTFKLGELLEAWRQHLPHGAEAGIDALRGVTGDTATHAALTVLHEAFCALAEAQVAVLRVDLTLSEIVTRICLPFTKGSAPAARRLAHRLVKGLRIVEG